MLMTRGILVQKRQAILEIAQRYGASDVRVFGPVAR
jgi:predicted nucleotidyltransferase